VRKELHPGLQSESVETYGTGDGIRKRRVVLLLGSPEERFWIDINLAYHVLKDKYNFTDEEIILLTYNNNVPASLTDFDPSWIDDSVWIDGVPNPTILEDTFQSLSAELDGDDWLFFVFDGHGSGYYGPRTQRQYWNAKVPNSIYDGPINTSEYDDPDYKEDEFQTEFIPSGQVNCVKYDLVSTGKGLGKFLPCFDYYPSFIKAGDTYYRFKLVSHFDNLPLLDGSTASDSDIYIEKVISYAECDLNRNTIIEANEVNLCDWDGDGRALMRYSSGFYEFDEDDWFDRYTAEENYHPYSRINGLSYCFVDKNLDNTLDLIGFQSDSDPLYLDCLAGQANPNDLTMAGSDTDNNGFANFLNINLDDDLNDYLSFDETLSFGYSIYDDEFASLFSMIDPNTTKIFLTESCFSAGFLRDLSYQHVISMSASEEDDTSSGNYFIRHFFMALNKGCEQFGTPTTYPSYDCNSSFYNDIEENLDLDADSLISIAEAFRKSYEKRVTDDFPMLDDNADLEESYGDSLTFIHELSYSAPNDAPEGIYGDSTFLDEAFFGDINQVACYDFDGPLGFATLSRIIHYGTYYTDYTEPGRIFDCLCDGKIYKSFVRYLCDFDHDTDVDFVDLSFFALAWLAEPPDPQWNPVYDISDPADEVINMLDLGAFVDNWLAGVR